MCPNKKIASKRFTGLFWFDREGLKGSFTGAVTSKRQKQLKLNVFILIWKIA